MGNYFFVLICTLFVIGIFLLFYLIKKHRNTYGHKIQLTDKKTNVTEYSGDEIVNNSLPISLKFEELTTLSKSEELRLVEISNTGLLAKIDNIIPGTLNLISNSKIVKDVNNSIKTTGQLYQVIIPAGEELVKSKEIEGAFRGFYRKGKIAGQANLVPANINVEDKLDKLNLVNSVMDITSMVVGQYYMAQINNQLKGISNELSKLTVFQDNEFRSKVFALVADVQKSSVFKMDIIDNDELRNNEINYLRILEHECIELLGQTNLTLERYIENSISNYADYEKNVSMINVWNQYQQFLISVLSKIDELNYALNLGEITRENSYAMFNTYIEQTERVHNLLISWHNENMERFNIDIDTGRRLRFNLFGVLNYKKISENTLSMIEKQNSDILRDTDDRDDLFKNDVRLIAKDGKLFYLPNPNNSDLIQ